MNKLKIVSWSLMCVGIPVAAQTAASVPSASRETTALTQPHISQLVISPDTVSELHLKPNFATTILMPEPVANVVLGAPTLFDEEHSEHAPELVVVKPITDRPATSNLWISTRSGQHVSLKLLNDGDTSAANPVDYVLVYREHHDFLIPSDDPADALLGDQPSGAKQPSPLDAAFESQQHVASPLWNPEQSGSKQPLKIAASIGSVTNDGDGVIVAFSVLNRSSQWVEVLPPQIELNNPAEQAQNKKAKKKQKNILADQIPIDDYRYTQRKLAPGVRADGVVRFERPDYKQAQERIQLELATADAIDRPLLLNLPFTAPVGSRPAAAPQPKEAGNARP
jgi:hypothetical protein